MSSPIITTQLFRATYDNQHTEDISAGLIQASASMDPRNDQTWSMDASLTLDLWDSLEPYFDWVAPVVTTTYPDGTVRRGQLGLYLVLDSPEEHFETYGRVRLQAADPLWLVARQGFTRKLDILANTAKDRALRAVLDGAALTEDPNGKPRYTVPATQERFKKAREYPRSDNRLVVANEIAQGYGCYNLWSTKDDGYIRTKRMGEARLSERTPLKVYSANVPADYFIDERFLPLGGLASEVLDSIPTTPKGDDLVNEILMVNDDPNLPRINVRGRITHPNNPRSVLRKKKRRRVRKIHNPIVEEDATAEEVARALLQELSTLNETLRLTAVLDPEPDFARETVACAIWNAWERKIAVGQYAVHSVQYTDLTPRSGKMTLDLGRIDDASDVLFASEEEADLAA